MKLDEMKVQYDRIRDGFTKESEFSVQPKQTKIKTDISGIAVKIGLCAAVLIMAFVVRAIGYGATEENIAATSANSNANGAAQQEQDERTQIGSLQYVDNGTAAKWTSPVMTNDIELLRDGQLLRFTATGENVQACMNGEVISVLDDTDYGKCVRIQSESDCETIYYGFEAVAVSENDEISAGDTLGTVQIGRSVYLKVLEKGEPQDPTGYVDLSLRHE